MVGIDVILAGVCGKSQKERIFKMPKKIKALEDEVYNWRFLAEHFSTENKKYYKYFQKINELAKGSCQLCRRRNEPNKYCNFCVHTKLPTDVKNCIDLWYIVEEGWE